MGLIMAYFNWRLGQEIESLRDQLQAKEQEMEELQQHFDLKVDEIEKLQEENAQLQEELNVKTEEIDNLINDMPQGNPEEL